MVRHTSGVSFAGSGGVRPPVVLREVASLSHSGSAPGGGAMAYGWHQAPSDRRLAAIMHNEALRGQGWTGDVVHTFQEMEDKDGHYFAVLQTRKLGLLSRAWQLHPPADATGPKAAMALELARRTLAGLSPLRPVLHHLLDCLGKGMAVAEVMWHRQPDGAVLPAMLVPRWPGRFRFAADASLRRHDPGDPLEGLPMPERKLLITTFEHPQGPGVPLGLGARAYWYSWFKRTNLRSWGLFNEKFGAPTVVARHPQGLSEDERRTMLEALDCIHHDAGVALPEHIGLTLLEASRPGSADSYRQLAEWCNDEISRIVLGATLTTGEGHRSGSLALGRVHDSIRHEYVMADAAVLEEALDRLLRWVVDVNLGVDTPAPTITFDTMSHDRLLADAQLDRELVALGLPLSVDDFYDRYNRPRPTPDAAVINYDDRNVFQYHLRYGVLTINEVRARMGLAPVPWGDTRTGTETWAPSSPDPGGEQVRAESDHDGAKGREDPQRDDPTETEPEPGDAA